MLLELDAGEHDDEPEELWALFDVLNVACGGHAGDDASMARIAAFCAARARPRIGAHPSYPDREGFGRRTIAIAEDALEDAIAAQCAALARIAGDVGWLKPHGALYHDAAADPARARAVVRGAVRALGGKVAVIGPRAGALRDAAAAAGLPYLREGFADRRARPDGTLVPRSEPDALVTDPVRAAAQARALAGDVDAICVHGDTPGALAIARAVREAVDRTAPPAAALLAGRRSRLAVTDFQPLGDRSIRFARPAVPAGALVRAVRAWPGVVDVVVARDDVAAYFAGEPRVDPAWLEALAALAAGDREPVREHALPAVYDGPDLDELARAAGLPRDEVVRRHAAATYVVDTIGFQPGFAYLAGLDPALARPRRATPRPRVPAGSIGIAGDRTGVYPFESPGGWNLVGRVVGVELFGPSGALLALGDRVRFVP